MGNGFLCATFASALHVQYLLSAEDLGDARSAVDVGAMCDDWQPD